MLGLFFVARGSTSLVASALDRRRPSNSQSNAHDAADNATNVLPYAEFVSDGLYQYVSEFSRGGPEPPPSRFLELVTIELKELRAPWLTPRSKSFATVLN